MTRIIDLDEISDNQYVDKKVVAMYLSVSIRTVETLTSKRKIPAYKIGSSVRYRLSEVREWMELKNYKARENHEK